MTINISDLPVVREQIEREGAAAPGPASPAVSSGQAVAASQAFRVADLPAVKADAARAAAATTDVEYVRAPDGPGYQPAGRPHATQRNSR